MLTRQNMISTPSAEAEDIRKNKALAVLSYIGFLFLAPLLLRPESKFSQYHAKQGMVLFFLELLIGFLDYLPFIGGILWYLGFLAILVLAIKGIINVLEERCAPLPKIGHWAEKIKI